MKEKFTFFVTSNCTGPVKEITVSRGVLRGAAFFVSVLFAVASLWVVDSFSLRHRFGNLASKGRAGALEEVSLARLWDHIKKLDYDINRFKSKMARMSALEEKLRLMAKVDLGLGEDPHGVGGPLPEDMDPRTAFKATPGKLLVKMRKEMLKLQQAAIDREQNLETLLDLLERQWEIFSRTPTGRPAPGRISSGYGWRRSPFTGRREFHRGMDIATYRGAPVTAPADGVVKFSGRRGGLGKVLVIDHGHGIVTRYGHLSKIYKKPGDRVKRGDLVARVGNTGRSTGPHLHYEIRVGGKAVNPRKFMFN